MPFPFPLLCSPLQGQAEKAARHHVLASCLLLQTAPDLWQVRPGRPTASVKLKEVRDPCFCFVPVTALITPQPYDIIVISSQHSNFAVAWGKRTTVLIRGWFTRGPAALLAAVLTEERPCQGLSISPPSHLLQPVTITKLIKLFSCSYP